MLEEFIKKSLFSHTPNEATWMKSNSDKAVSFLEMKEKLQSKEKSQAGPVLKAMLFGFPNPRSYAFTSQNDKGKNGGNFFFFIL